MRDWRHETWAIAAALGLHAAALVALRVAIGERSEVPAVNAQRPSLEVSLDVDSELDEPAEVEGDELEQRVARSDARVSPGRADRGWRAPADGPKAGDATAASDATELVVPSESEASEGAPANAPLDLGIGPDGWQRWVTTKPGERTASPRSEPRRNRFDVYRAPPVSTSGGLHEGLEKRDRELGLGPSGRVMSAMHNAAHQPAAPQVGVARFDITVNRAGVVEVTLGGASGEVEGWKKVAKHIADDLRASPPPIKPPREGVRLVVELIAEETMPNGVRIKSLKKPHLEVTPPKLQSVERSLEDLEKDNPTAEGGKSTLPPIKLDLPGVYLAERGKVCSYRLGLSALGPIFQGGCDLSNLGAKPQRMVRARVIEQTLF
jgi:hypothetical protein